MHGMTEPLRLACRGPEESRTSLALAAPGSGWALVTDGAADAEYIALPRAERAAAVLAALRAGRHVLVEAPFAADWTEFDAVLLEAQTRGLRLATVFPDRFRSDCSGVRERISRGVLDEITEVRIGIAPGAPWAAALAPLDLVRWTLGHDPVAVTAVGPAGPLRVRYGHLSLDARIAPEPNVPAGGWSLSFVGARGREVLAAQPGRGACAELLADFAAACREGREPEVNALDGMAALAFMRAAEAAVRTGAESEFARFHFEHEEDARWEREQRREPAVKDERKP